MQLAVLKYIVEDSTIAELLGVQNFTNDESAVLELVKNAYDAGANVITLNFEEAKLTIVDDGVGMSALDIKRHWMHVGKSDKKYEIIDSNNNIRVLAGSKGIGRFALSRLGKSVEIYSKKEQSLGISWSTDWSRSSLQRDNSLQHCGTKIVINELRDKWRKKKVENLATFLSKTYNDTLMRIVISHPEFSTEVTRYFTVAHVGVNCLSTIRLDFDSEKCILITSVESDEFQNEAKDYCLHNDINNFCTTTDLIDELKSSKELDMSSNELVETLKKLGDFSAEFYFYVSSNSEDMKKFLYKHSSVPAPFKGGIVLYRNAFSLSAYEGKKDWLGLGKRSRKSPAAASHPTGAWRVRENQLTGKVEIDKQRNAVLQDLSNRQGLDENVYYQTFIEVLSIGLSEFERYRQNIIRLVNVKNADKTGGETTPISDTVVSDPKSVLEFTVLDAEKLAVEIKNYRKANYDYKREKENVEKRYKYDVRILNVLSTIGLKASSIAHEMRNDRNAIADNSDNIVLALKEYDMWDELSSPIRTDKAYKNVPYLIQSNRDVSVKIIAFMNAMLLEVEKKQFKIMWHKLTDLFDKIKSIWETDYSWVHIALKMEEDIDCLISQDVIFVIFDNLILNSLQQNEGRNHLNISIVAESREDSISFVYADDGKGLDNKYASYPRRILEVHESTRKNGHGLGMWIVNNTIVMSGGEITNIHGGSGFKMEFFVGREI